jgi:hypothetical protein
MLAGVAAALLALAPADARASSCVPSLTWRGTLYSGGYGPGAVDAVEFGARIGTGYFPDCADTGGEPGPPEPVGVTRIVGVRPAIAVGTTVDRDVYLAENFFVESPRHPLHRIVFRRGAPDETRGWSCGRAFRRIGRVTAAPPAVLRITFRSRPRGALFVVDAKTRFSKRLTRFGVPYLAEGTRVVVTATRCTASRGRSKLVARSFATVTDAALAG